MVPALRVTVGKWLTIAVTRSAATHRLILSAAVLTTALGGSAIPARADENASPPTHLTAYNLAWLDYLDPADQPAYPEAVCIVDSGLAVTPDTPADDPTKGPVLARLSTDGGPGEPQGNAPEQLHGTHMGAAAIAPQNGWGTIGAWSGGRIVSVRAMTDNATTFTTGGYFRGINKCLKSPSALPIAVISLSLGCEGCTPSDQELAAIDNAIQLGHQRGISVVAAAGNTAGAGAQLPASRPGVFAVGAGALDGSLCSYGSFDGSVAVLGPACPVGDADPLTGAPYSNFDGGSSAATAVTSTLLAALRSLRPDADWSQTETWVRDSARMVNGRRMLDGKAAAIAAGLGDVVARAEARQAQSHAISPTPTSSPSAAATATATATATVTPSTGPGSGINVQPGGRRRLARPRVSSARWSRGRVVIKVRNLPSHSRLRVVAEQMRDDFHVRRTRTRTLSASRVTLRLSWRPDQLQLRYLGPATDGDVLPSRTIMFHRVHSRFR